MRSGRADTRASRTRPPQPTLLLVVLGALSAFGPLSMDLYLPGMPGLAESLKTTEASAQFTISTCMIGLAAGQLFSGPLSDRMGRRIPLVVGVAGFVVASVVCALAPTIEMLLVARLVQGLCGAAGIVISRAVVRDLFKEQETARVFSRLTIVTGVAPVVAPVAGGFLLLITDWRGLFLVLAGVGLVLLAGAVLVVPDSLDPENRHVGGVRSQLRDMAELLRRRQFVGYALTAGISGCALFAYISMSSLVLQEDYGLSAQAFSAVFAVNAIGIVVLGQINGALVGRVHIRLLLQLGLGLTVFGGVATLLVPLTGLPVWFLLPPIFVTVVAQGAIMADTSALALGPYARGAGAASAVLGTSQFLFGALIPPLVSLAGTTGTTMGATMLVAGTVAVVVLLSMTKGSVERNAQTNTGRERM